MSTATVDGKTAAENCAKDRDVDIFPPSVATVIVNIPRLIQYWFGWSQVTQPKAILI
jgi:hypothetical protein